MSYAFNNESCRRVYERYSDARPTELEELMKMIYGDGELRPILERGDLAHFGTLGVFVTSERIGDRLSFTRFDGSFSLSQKKPKGSIKGQNGNFSDILAAIKNKRQVRDKLKNAVLEYVVRVDSAGDGA